MNRLSYSIPQIMEETSLGRTLLYRAMAEGKLLYAKCGKRRVVLAPDLLAFLEGLRVEKEAR